MAAGLKDRAQQRAATANGAGTPGKEVAVPSLRTQIQSMLPQFEMAMPKGFEAKQLMRDAFTLMSRNPKLAECQPETVLGGLMTFAQLGLRPGVMGQGWLIPFKTRANINGRWQDVYQAQIVIGYLGYVELIHRTGSIRKIIGRAVHANDFYEVEYGFNEGITHRPPPRGVERGPVVGYYAIIFPNHGDPMFWDMTVEECREWRAHYAMSTKKDRDKKPIYDENGNTSGSGPWYEEDGPEGGTGFDQMSIKTCFLRAKRFAPKSTDRLLTAATEVDGAVRMSYKPEAPDDYDEMLTADHPNPEVIVVDGEVVDEPAPAPAPAAARPQPETAAKAPVDDDEEPGKATQAQHKRIMALLGKRITSDEHRHALFTELCERPITSQAQVTAAEADTVYEILKGWGQAGALDREVAALAPGTAPAATTTKAAELPKPGTPEWHADGHPSCADGINITRVPNLLNGDCAICEDDR